MVSIFLLASDAAASSVCMEDITGEHSPEKGVRSVVVDLAFCVFPMQALPGALLHHTGFRLRALARTAWLHRAVDRGCAASLRFGLGHGFATTASSALSADPVRF